MNPGLIKLGKMIIAISVAAMPFLIGSCAPMPVTPSPVPENEAPVTPSPTPEDIELGELKELERNIVIEAEGETLHYFEQKKWTEDKFTRLIEEEEKFGSDQIEKFKATYGVDAGNFDVEINKKEKSTILKCDIYVELDTWYDFQWFLRPLGLDFMDDHFERLERELSWEGSLNEVKTTILLKFAFKIDNCHAHVWAQR
jgi:hypothetical protein